MQSARETRFCHLFEKTDAIAMQGFDRNQRVSHWNTASEIGGLELEAEGNVLLAELGRSTRHTSVKSDGLRHG